MSLVHYKVKPTIRISCDTSLWKIPAELMFTFWCLSPTLLLILSPLCSTTPFSEKFSFWRKFLQNGRKFWQFAETKCSHWLALIELRSRLDAAKIRMPWILLPPLRAKLSQSQSRWSTTWEQRKFGGVRNCEWTDVRLAQMSNVWRRKDEPAAVAFSTSWEIRPAVN